MFFFDLLLFILQNVVNSYKKQRKKGEKTTQQLMVKSVKTNVKTRLGAF